ncbi:MAG TPA: DUF1573 domain-containing protein [Chitinophagales bacterium]|nr:DUF1573 domain-containing protein [Chitinophagales bacterium]
MKKQTHFLTICLLVLMGVFTSCKEETSSDRIAKPEEEEQISTDIIKNTTVITFERDTYNFGDIKEGDTVATDFKFVNTGDHDLLITNAKGSCGCTVPDWPKEPIAPGASGVIKVVFNSKNKSGAISKTVTVQANTVPNPTRLTIKGNVIK